MDPPEDESQRHPAVAPSIVSAQMTDIVSEDGDEYYPEGAARAQNRSPRPSSPPTRYSARGFSSRRGQHGFGGPGLSMANTSRPQGSSERQTASHATSLTARGFFRPLSSQRLQAQRSNRTLANAPEPLPRLSSSTAPRPSMDSRQSVTPRRPGTADIPPSSRGTEFSERDQPELALYNAGPVGDRTVPSAGESTSPLHPSGPHVPPSEGEKQQEGGPGSSSQFRSNLLRLSQKSANAPTPVQTDMPRSRSTTRPARTSSDTMSPHLHEKVMDKATVDAGRNHEYFTGNTAFCWSGRLQNTRERPINILTGLLVVVPSALWFAFAYVLQGAFPQQL